MANPKAAARRTSDRTVVGVKVSRHTSIAAVKGAYPGSPKTAHTGQPTNMAGKGLKTGHKGNNTGSSY